MIKKLIKKEKKQLIALFISLISLIIFSLLDNKIDKIFLFFFIGDLIIIFVDVCLELKNIGKIKKIKNSILKETFIDRTVFIRSETVRSSMSLFCDGNKLRSRATPGLSDCLQSRNVPFGTSDDCFLQHLFS